jgi:hypothetical protein
MAYNTKEKIISFRKLYWEKNKDILKAAQKEYYNKNKKNVLTIVTKQEK